MRQSRGRKRFWPAGVLAIGLAVAGSAHAAELPAQSKNAPAKKGAEPTKALPSCDVGGVRGVLAPNGLCVRMSGYVSATVGGGSIR